MCVVCVKIFLRFLNCGIVPSLIFFVVVKKYPCPLGTPLVRFFFFSTRCSFVPCSVVYQYLLLFLFLSFVLVTSQIVFFYKISNLSINFITTSNFEIICTLCAYIQFRKQLLNTFIYILLCC